MRRAQILRRGWVTILAAVGAVAAAPAAAGGRADIYGALPEIRMLTIAPDGATIAWRKTTADSDAIMIYSLANRQTVGGVTVDEELNPTRLEFATRDKLVLVVSEHGRVPGFRGKFNVSSAYLYNLESGKVSPLLVPGDIVYVGQSGLGSIVGVSADNRYIYMPAFSGDAKVVDTPNYSVFRVDLDSPWKRKVDFAGKRRSNDFLLDSESEVLVHEYFEDSGNRHVIAVRDGKKFREIYSKDTALPEIGLIGLAPDRETVVVASYDDDTRRRSYYAMSPEDGTITGTLFGRKDADVDSVIMDINRVVYGVKYSGFTPSYEFLDPEITARIDAVAKQVDGNAVHLVDWTRDWQSLVVYVEGSAFSGQYFLLTKGQEPTMIANARPGFDDETINPIARYSFQAADGLTIPTLLTIPRARVNNLKKLPAVVLPHGGPAAHDSIGFDWFAQALADEGYLVIQPQFRGSTGFGIDHRVAGYGEWGRKMQSDLSDAVTALTQSGYIDPARVCIVGMSYGGYAALAGGAFTPDLYRCVASINGVTNLVAMVDYDNYWTRDNETSQAYLTQTLGKGELDRDALRAVSPAYAAEAFEVPVLLIHSDDDEIVPFRQSKQMHSRLKKAGKNVTLIELKDDGHSLHEYDNRVRTVREVVEFVSRNLGAAP